MGSSSVFLFYLSGYLICCFLTPRQADIYGIFCSAEIFTTSLHQGREFFCSLTFSFVFRRNDILSGRLSSNSCSAALICVFCATRRIRFLFQTFSRSDPPGKAPLTRGRYVFKKEKKGKGGKRKKREKRKKDII